MDDRRLDVVVVGAGPAGLAAAEAVRESGFEELTKDDRLLLPCPILVSTGYW